MNANNITQMEHHNHDYDAGNGVSLLVGFLLAFSNSIFGWLGKIQVAADWNTWIQALILGFIGSTATYFTNKFWKYIMGDKKKDKK